MMITNMVRSVMKGIMIGSFIYCINIATGSASQDSAEVISVWIASAAIGGVSILYHFNISEVICVSAQVVVGLVSFTFAALFNGWIELSINEIIWYAFVIFILMLIIIGVQYIFSILDSRKINKKLNKEK